MKIIETERRRKNNKDEFGGTGCIYNITITKLKRRNKGKKVTRRQPERREKSK